MSETYDQIKSMVVGFALRPGDRLNESALSKDLGVSRTPLREAFNRLVAEGLIDARPGKGSSAGGSMLKVCMTCTICAKYWKWLR